MKILLTFKPNKVYIDLRFDVVQHHHQEGVEGVVEEVEEEEEMVEEEDEVDSEDVEVEVDLVDVVVEEAEVDLVEEAADVVARLNECKTYFSKLSLLWYFQQILNNTNTIIII